MKLTENDHRVTIAGSEVGVTAKTGMVHATWTLLIDGAIAATATASGDFLLDGTLPDGSTIVASVHQSMLGPSEVVLTHGEIEVERFKGFVL